MKSWFTKVVAIFAGWTVLAVLLATSIAIYRNSVGVPTGFVQVLRISLLDYWIWAALTPIIFYLAQRFPFRRASWPSTTVLHFVFYLFLTGLHEVLSQLAGLPAGTPASYHGSVLWLRFVSSLYNDLWMYWPAVVIWSLLHYYERYRERDLRAAQLDQELTRAELQALRNQLHPHFLFNTLNSVASLMHEDVSAADDMLADLSDLLRAYLKGNGEQEIHLRQELNLLDTYVRIQKRRFEGRLNVLFDVPRDLLDAAVPALILQPLVENSILHGIAPQTNPGYVRVSIRPNGAVLSLEITDNGAGLPESYREGIGLANTRARLRQLYGDRCSFSLANSEVGGVNVLISLPLRFLATQPQTDSDVHTYRSGGRRAAGTPADSVAAPR